MELKVVANDLALGYGPTVVAEKLSFTVGANEFVSLIGPSGCGKSSTLRAIGGLLAPRAGELRVDGRAVDGPRPQEVAFVFQDLALYPWRSALRNVEVALQFAGVGRRERRAKALEALHTVGLDDAAGRFPNQLSGGMRQRVAIARALVSDAPLLLLDEPFAALDELTRLRLGKQLITLLEEQDKTVLFVTHSLAEAAYLSDRILVMSPAPATIAATIEVPLSRPRQPQLLRTPQFHALVDQLSALLLEGDQP